MITTAPGRGSASVDAGTVGARWGLVVTLALVVVTFAAPPVFGWDVHARTDGFGAPPLHGYWDVKVGVGTVPALLLAAAGFRYAHGLSRRLPWRVLLGVAYVAGLAWLFSLALVDGTAGLTRALGNSYEYLPTARAVTDVPALLAEYVDRIPYDRPDRWVVHVAGHPPGMLLFFVALVRLGLGGDLAAGVVVTLLAGLVAPAVLVTLRTLGREGTARDVAPFLVLGPSAVFLAVSGEAISAVTSAWGLAALAFGATARSTARKVSWSAVAGLLLGAAVLTGYGFVLLGCVALAVLVVTRSWWPLPIAAAAALVPVLVLGVFGFALWDAYPVLHERYWDGIGGDRPTGYWVFGSVAALAISAGPLLGAGLGNLAVLRHRADRVVLLLSGGAALSILLAVVSLMSKAETERIWLPFVPWLLLTTALLPDRWRHRGLALQLATALVVQHVLYTSW